MVRNSSTTGSWSYFSYSRRMAKNWFRRTRLMTCKFVCSIHQNSRLNSIIATMFHLEDSFAAVRSFWFFTTTRQDLKTAADANLASHLTCRDKHKGFSSILRKKWNTFPFWGISSRKYPKCDPRDYRSYLQVLFLFARCSHASSDHWATGPFQKEQLGARYDSSLL